MILHPPPRSIVAQVLLILLLCLGSVPAYAAQNLVVVADDWCPYTCDPASGHEGYLVDILRHIFEPAGFKVEYLVIPWSRCLYGVSHGTYDAALGTSPSELKSGVFPDHSVGVYSNHFFVRKESNWRFDGVESLEHIILGGVQDYDYGALMPYINQWRDTEKVQLLTGSDVPRRSVIKLLNGRIDVYVEDLNVAMYAAFQLDAEDRIRVADREGDQVRLFVGFSPATPRSPGLAALFDKGLEQMRRDGSLDQILHTYGLHDWLDENPSAP